MFLHVYRESISIIFSVQTEKGLVMSVQLLSSEYISKVKPQVVEQWVNDGIVKKQGNQYFVAGKNISSFNENCYVKDGDSAKLYQINAKGTVVERTTPQQKGEVIGTPQKSYSVNVSGIIERMGLTDKTLQAKFKTFLSSQQGLKIDTDGNISFGDQAALNKALKDFAQQHQENFVDPNADKFIEFTSNSAQEIIDSLAQGGAIATQPTNGRYAVKNEAALNNTLNTQVGGTTYEAANGRSATLEAGITTTTTTKEGVVDVPDNLKDSRAQRKQLEKSARDGYADLVANADDATRNAMNIYIAESKYHKQIDKKEQELLKSKTLIGGNGGKEKTTKRDEADIIKLYIKKYANEDDKAKLNKLVAQIQNSNNIDDQQRIMKALKDIKLVEMDTDFDSLSDKLKEKGALLCMAKACGFESKDLLRLMATYEVMNERDTAQVLKDDEYFIKHQAKDFVKNKQAEQDIANTTVHFSKKGKKGIKDGKIHNDIGKRGRDLVKTCPEMLCDEITDISKFKKDEDGYFEAEIDGKTRYFKFNQDKWKTFMGICCDPKTATDAEMKILFGDDEKKKDAFLKDLNLTLQEGRSLFDMKLPSPYGETGTVSLEAILGKVNDNVSNRELNRIRDLVESAGYSVDANNTNLKRALHVAKNAAIGAGAGFLTGGMGSLLAGAINFAGETASQLISYSGTTDAVQVDYSGTTEDRVIHDSTTFEYTSNGEDFSQTVNKDITVEGQEYSGTVTVDGQKYSGQVEAKGQKYSGSGNNHLKTAGYASILGAVAGAVKSLASMRGIHDRGRNMDDVFNLTRIVSNEETETGSLSIEIPQFTEVQTRRGQMEVGTEPIIHRYTTVIAGVKQELMACYPGATEEDYAQILDAVAQTNGIKDGNATGKLWAGRYTDENNKKHNGIYVPPTITLQSGKVLTYQEEHTNATKISSGGSGRHYNVTANSTKRTLHAQGTIKS